MMERKGMVTFAGNPLTLVGNEVRVGDKAPDFTVLDKDMKEVKLSDFRGKIKILSVTPSLDTPVCSLQASTFNREAEALGDKIVTINLSMDLPFAIARFCQSEGITKIRTLSDHRDASFGNGYGVLIKELRLLSRSIFVIDGSDVIRYIEMVPEITNEPDYQKAVAAARALL
jgi:thioredoxin-dependent peroxiredoxin